MYRSGGEWTSELLFVMSAPGQKRMRARGHRRKILRLSPESWREHFAAGHILRNNAEYSRSLADAKSYLVVLMYCTRWFTFYCAIIEIIDTSAQGDRHILEVEVPTDLSQPHRRPCRSRGERFALMTIVPFCTQGTVLKQHARSPAYPGVYCTCACMRVTSCR